jgi:hypothetical protein
MNTHHDILENRRLVKAGIVLGYAGAIALTITRFANTDPGTVGETLGSLAMGLALATPATLAALSLDRRPTLLPAAAIAAAVTSFIASVMLPVGLITAFIWYRAWAARPVPAPTSRTRAAARVGLGLLVLTSMLSLFIHVDPVCIQRLTDGSERTVDAASRGFNSGWAFGIVQTQSGSSSSGIDVAEEICTSNTVVLGEAGASLTLTALVLALGFRWPQGVRTTSGSNLEEAAQLPILTK